jgi:hypothetical protein
MCKNPCLYYLSTIAVSFNKHFVTMYTIVRGAIRWLRSLAERQSPFQIGGKSCLLIGMWLGCGFDTALKLFTGGY